MTSLQALALTAAITAQLAPLHTTGAAVAVLEHGHIVYEHAFGERRLSGPPADVHTRFEIGSDTKQFTAAAILQLKERRRLSLDDRLAAYVPGFPHANELTIRQLLYQTSGLPDYLMTNHFIHIMQTTPGGLANIERFAAGPLHFKPGTKWEYSNSNYAALTAVIEAVSGEPYEQYVREHLFLRAGMRESTFVTHEREIADLATGYWRGLHRNGRLAPAPQPRPGWLTGDGNIVSTVGDLAKWDIALSSGKIVTREDYALMTAPATLANGKRDDYGFGFWIDPLDGHTDVHHEGDTYGMSSSNNIFPDDDMDVIVLANYGFDAAGSIGALVVRWEDVHRRRHDGLADF